MAARVVVVGAGISGLATAWYLRRYFARGPLSIRVLDRSAQPGGTARTIRIAGYQLESGPNGFLTNKPDTLDLCEELGIGSRLRAAAPAARHRFVLFDEKPLLVPDGPMALVRSPLLGLRGKMRLLAEPWIHPASADADESIRDFGYRRLGRQATDVLLDAVVTGIYAGDYSRLSMAACFPTLVEWERSSGSLFRGVLGSVRARKAAASADTSERVQRPILLAPQGGMGEIIEALYRPMAADVELASAAHSLSKASDQSWLVTSDEGQTWNADAVVLACHSFAQADLVRGFDQAMADDLAGIRYCPAVVCSLGYPHARLPKVPVGFGYITPEHLGQPVLGVQWISCIFPEQAPTGHFQFRAILGGARRPDVLQWSDSEIVRAVRDDLRRALDITAEPSFSWIYRWGKGIPQYEVGHLERVRRIEERAERLPGLFLIGNSLRGVSFNDCVANARRIAHAVAEYLSSPRQVTACGGREW